MKVISVVSGKGGVGKTTAVSNLAVALEKTGKKVVVVDGDVSASNLSQHFDIEPGRTLEDVKEEIKAALYKHETGVGIIPSSTLNFSSELPNLRRYLERFEAMDFILIDSPPGCDEGVKKMIESSDEVLIVTEPEMPAITNALGVKDLAEESGKEIPGVVLNKVKGKRSELKEEEVKSILGEEIIGKIPLDKKVGRAIAIQEPVIHEFPKSKSSKAFNKLARKMAGKEVEKKSFLKKAYERVKGFFGFFSFAEEPK